MTIIEALNVNNNNKASDQEIFQATVLLKARFEKSRRAFERRGIVTPLIKSIQARVETRPELFKKPLGKLSKAERFYVFDTYRQYAGNFFKNEWRLNKTATLKGYLDSQKEIATKVLGNSDYSKWSEDEKKKFWDLVDASRELDSGFFGLGSEKGIKAINTIVNVNGITDINEIKKRLESEANEYISNLFADDGPFKL
jgi:hypothetical protein